jgi:hypothetical protein
MLREAIIFMQVVIKLKYASKRVQVNQDGLKLNGTHELSAYADDVNTFAASYLNTQG